MATSSANHVDFVYDRLKFDKAQIEGGSYAKVEVESFSLKDFWTQFEAAVQGLSNEVTKIGFLCSQEPYPKISDLELMMANLMQYYNMTRDLFCVLPQESGQTLHKSVTSAVVSIIRSLQDFVLSLNDLSKNGVTLRLPLTGAVWEACSAVSKLPKDNAEASLRVIEAEKSLTTDALEELNTVNINLPQQYDTQVGAQENQELFLASGLPEENPPTLLNTHQGVPHEPFSDTLSSTLNLHNSESVLNSPETPTPNTEQDESQRTFSSDVKIVVTPSIISKLESYVPPTAEKRKRRLRRWSLRTTDNAAFRLGEEKLKKLLRESPEIFKVEEEESTAFQQNCNQSGCRESGSDSLSSVTKLSLPSGTHCPLVDVTPLHQVADKPKKLSYASVTRHIIRMRAERLKTLLRENPEFFKVSGVPPKPPRPTITNEGISTHRSPIDSLSTSTKSVLTSVEPALESRSSPNTHQVERQEPSSNPLSPMAKVMHADSNDPEKKPSSPLNTQQVECKESSSNRLSSVAKFMHTDSNDPEKKPPSPPNTHQAACQESSSNPLSSVAKLMHTDSNDPKIKQPSSLKWRDQSGCHVSQSNTSKSDAKIVLNPMKRRVLEQMVTFTPKQKRNQRWKLHRTDNTTIRMTTQKLTSLLYEHPEYFTDDFSETISGDCKEPFGHGTTAQLQKQNPSSSTRGGITGIGHNRNLQTLKKRVPPLMREYGHSSHTSTSCPYPAFPPWSGSGSNVYIRNMARPLMKKNGHSSHTSTSCSYPAFPPWGGSGGNSHIRNMVPPLIREHAHSSDNIPPLSTWGDSEGNGHIRNMAPPFIREYNHSSKNPSYLSTRGGSGINNPISNMAPPFIREYNHSSDNPPHSSTWGDSGVNNPISNMTPPFIRDYNHSPDNPPHLSTRGDSVVNNPVSNMAQPFGGEDAHSSDNSYSYPSDLTHHGEMVGPSSARSFGDSDCSYRSVSPTYTGEEFPVGPGTRVRLSTMADLWE